MYIFRKQIFGFMDLLRFKKMVPKRRAKLAEGSAEPIPKTYRVNETAKILHPGYQSATLVAVEEKSADMRTLTFETEKPLYFRAGQYVTVGCKVGESDVSRPLCCLVRAPRGAFPAPECHCQEVRLFQRVSLRRSKGRRYLPDRRSFGRFLLRARARRFPCRRLCGGQRDHAVLFDGAGDRRRDGRFLARHILRRKGGRRPCTEGGARCARMR